MRIGTLNRQVSLQRLLEGQNQETEAQEITWVEVAKVWANVRYLNGVETIKAATPVSISKASIRIRFRDDIDESWRVVYTSKGKTTYFGITSISPDLLEREFVDLACQTGANNG